MGGSGYKADCKRLCTAFLGISLTLVDMLSIVWGEPERVLRSSVNSQILYIVCTMFQLHIYCQNRGLSQLELKLMQWDMHENLRIMIA